VTSERNNSKKNIIDEALVLDEAIIEAARHLKRGGCVAMPTETVYGLAARVDLPSAIEAIFKIKQRPSFDPLIVHVADFDQISSLVNEWPPVAESLALAFWPGPLTLVVKKKPSVNPMITSGLETVGIRMPKHPLAMALIRAAGQPLAAPSANRFGRTSPTTAAHVEGEFKHELEQNEVVLLDGGPCEIGLESTVCLVHQNEIVILRPGGVTREALEKHFSESSELKHVRVEHAVGHHASPGHLAHHYETKKPLIVSWSEAFGERSLYEIGDARFEKSSVHEITLNEDPALAARLLYSQLRKGDAHRDSRALFLRRDLSQPHMRAGLWQAIDDRLSRAARLQIGNPLANDA
jgi:L-threonylcarbamoyladenylate synthase